MEHPRLRNCFLSSLTFLSRNDFTAIAVTTLLLSLFRQTLISLAELLRKTLQMAVSTRSDYPLTKCYCIRHDLKNKDMIIKKDVLATASTFSWRIAEQKIYRV